MPASEARVLANRQNAALSTGPKTPAGKIASRANSYKHGMTGEGVVLSESDSARVETLKDELTAEFRPATPSARALVDRLAVQVNRMERSAAHESASIAGRVRQALDDFEAPEGLDARSVARLRQEAADLALFDPSPEATLARKYDADAQRGFFRALKELRQIDRDIKADIANARVPAVGATTPPSLGSFSPFQNPTPALPSASRTRSRSAARDALLDEFLARGLRHDLPFHAGSLL